MASKFKERLNTVLNTGTAGVLTVIATALRFVGGTVGALGFAVLNALRNASGFVLGGLLEGLLMLRQVAGAIVFGTLAVLKMAAGIISTAVGAIVGLAPALWKGIGYFVGSLVGAVVGLGGGGIPGFAKFFNGITNSKVFLGDKSASSLWLDCIKAPLNFLNKYLDLKTLATNIFNLPLFGGGYKFGSAFKKVNNSKVFGEEPWLTKQHVGIDIFKTCFGFSDGGQGPLQRVSKDFQFFSRNTKKAVTATYALLEGLVLFLPHLITNVSVGVFAGLGRGGLPGAALTGVQALLVSLSFPLRNVELALNSLNPRQKLPVFAQFRADVNFISEANLAIWSDALGPYLKTRWAESRISKFLARGKASGTAPSAPSAPASAEQTSSLRTILVGPRYALGVVANDDDAVDGTLVLETSAETKVDNKPSATEQSAPVNYPHPVSSLDIGYTPLPANDQTIQPNTRTNPRSEAVV